MGSWATGTSLLQSTCLNCCSTENHIWVSPQRLACVRNRSMHILDRGPLLACLGPLPHFFTGGLLPLSQRL